MADESWPFIGTEARASGTVTKRTLRSQHDMIYRNVYLPKGRQLTPVTRAAAAWLWSGRDATVAGLSAAALHGSRWIDAGLPAELIRGEGCSVDGIVIHREKLAGEETCRTRGIPATTPARTGFDIGRRDRLSTAVIRVDALANATGITPSDVGRIAERHRGSRGLVQLRNVLKLMDGGAESPQETRTRLLLVNAGLRKPKTQIVVVDDFGRPFARIDMGWEDWKVGIEYDGAQHWTDPAQRTWDIDRWAHLEAKGWVIVRVSRDLLRYRPHVVLERVVAALKEAGCPWIDECGFETRFGAVGVG
jgi:very-short-patch-repair endonuclease